MVFSDALQSGMKENDHVNFYAVGKIEVFKLGKTKYIGLKFGQMLRGVYIKNIILDSKFNLLIGQIVLLKVFLFEKIEFQNGYNLIIRKSKIEKLIDRNGNFVT